MHIRLYRDADLERLIALFGASVHGLAAGEYDQAQRDAWAPAKADLAAWHARLQLLTTLVAEDERTTRGFLAYRANGHIDLLYTAPDAARQGVASALYAHAERRLMNAGVHDVSVEASLVAMPFFARQGFAVMEDQLVTRHGVAFRRYLMGKRIVDS